MKVPRPNFILHSMGNSGPLPQLTSEETEFVLHLAEEEPDEPLAHGCYSSVHHEYSAKVPAVVNTQCDCRRAVPGFSTSTSSHTSPIIPKPGVSSPCFKRPVPREPFTCVSQIKDGVTVQMPRTPIYLPRLLGLSFSQPNSPKTPVSVRSSILRRLAATPVASQSVRQWFEQGVLNTPCVMEALHELKTAEDRGLPDMLALIEDDLAGLNQVEKHLLCNTDVELTDTNVVDYLLDVAADLSVSGARGQTSIGNHHRQQQQQQQQQQRQSETRQSDSSPASPKRPKCFIDTADRQTRPAQSFSADDYDAGEQSELNVRRKRRRRCQKRMTREEALSIRRLRNRRGRSRAAAAEASRQEEAEEAVVNAPEDSKAAVEVSAFPGSPVGVRRSKRKRRMSSRFEIEW